MNWISASAQSLIKAILTLKKPSEAERFLRDLLTEAEIIEFANRWQAAQLLDRGTPYRTIVEQTGLSSRTVARIQKWLNKGMGGYRLMLDRLASSTAHHTPPNVAGRG